MIIQAHFLPWLLTLLAVTPIATIKTPQDKAVNPLGLKSPHHRGKPTSQSRIDVLRKEDDNETEKTELGLRDSETISEEARKQEDLELRRQGELEEIELDQIIMSTRTLATYLSVKKGFDQWLVMRLGQRALEEIMMSKVCRQTIMRN